MKINNPIQFDLIKSFQDAYKQIGQSQSVLVISHQHPDGDTSGSALALWHFLISAGKNSQVFCKHTLPDQLLHLPNSDALTNNPSVFLKEWDTIIVCDSGDLVYAGVADYLKDKLIPIINFDHHASNTFFGKINMVDITASSTAEVVYRFFDANDILINKDIATCLLTAIFTDTGGFFNGATNAKSLQIAADLKKKGASIEQIFKSTMVNKQIPPMKLWGKALSRLSKTAYGIVYTYITQADLQEYNVSLDEVNGLSNYLSQAKDAKAIIVLTEHPNNIIKISMRTNQDDINLSELAKICGGGGHKKASGFTIPGRLFIQEGKINII